MANLHLVTGHAGSGHITATDQGAFNAALMGKGQIVLGAGNALQAQVISNNLIRVLDGELMMQGRFVRLEPGTYVDLAIDNGTQGTKRNDLIVARYSKNAATGVEECNLVVIKGESAASNPVDPECTEGDITNSEALLNDFPLWRIPIDGINVGNPVALFSTFSDSMLTILDGLRGHKHGAGDITSGTLSVSRGGTGIQANPSMLVNLAGTGAANVFQASPRPGVTGTLPVANGGTGLTASPSLLVNLAATAAANVLSSSPRPGVTGTLPVANGGTGATSMAALATALNGAGVLRYEIVSYTGTGVGGRDNPNTLTFSVVPKLVFLTATETAMHNGNNGIFGGIATTPRPQNTGWNSWPAICSPYAMAATENYIKGGLWFYEMYISGTKYMWGKCSADKKTISWYLDSPTNFYHQFNGSGITYYAIALY